MALTHTELSSVSLSQLCWTRAERNISFILSAINPKWAIRYFDELRALIKTEKITSLFCPVQHGNGRILSLMRRQYTPRQIIDALSGFKKVYPNLNIETELMLGFPSEGEEDFLAMLEMIKKIAFGSVLVYEYCEHEDIDSIKIGPKIPDHVIKERVTRLMNFCKGNNINCKYGS